MAFDQIELLLDDLEKIWVEYLTYKSLCESLIPRDELVAKLSAARLDPDRQEELKQRFGPLREQLRILAQNLAIADSSQAPPTKRPNQLRVRDIH